MADGKMSHDWELASNLFAILLSIHRDPKKHRKPVAPHEVNLYQLSQQKQRSPGKRYGEFNWADLKSMATKVQVIGGTERSKQRSD